MTNFNQKFIPINDTQLATKSVFWTSQMFVISCDHNAQTCKVHMYTALLCGCINLEVLAQSPRISCGDYRHQNRQHRLHEITFILAKEVLTKCCHEQKCKMFWFKRCTPPAFHSWIFVVFFLPLVKCAFQLVIWCWKLSLDMIKILLYWDYPQIIQYKSLSL